MFVRVDNGMFIYAEGIGVHDAVWAKNFVYLCEKNVCVAHSGVYKKIQIVQTLILQTSLVLHGFRYSAETMLDSKYHLSTFWRILDGRTTNRPRLV